MRVALVLAALLLLSSVLPSATVAATETVGVKGKTPPPLTVPHRLAQALVRQGYPVRQSCGVVFEPTPPRGKHAQLIHATELSACRLVIYKDGYSVGITPHSNRAAAKLAYQRSYNKWAGNTRSIAIGPLLVSAFRLPEADWNVIRRIVSTVTAR